MNATLGTMICALGGLAGAVFALPFRGIKGWKYESYWFVYALAGLIAFPMVLALVTCPDLFGVIGRADGKTLALCVGFGALWGLGGLTWGLMIRYLGIGLGLAIGCGLCSATGTLIPPIVTGHAGDLVANKAAVMTLASVIVSLVGIVLVGLAGKLKEGELDEEAKKKAVAEFDFKKGIVTAAIAGIFSAGMNFGLQGGGDIQRLAVEAGAKELWSGMPVIMVVLWGGFLVEAGWCAQQHIKNRTFGDYARPSLRNLLLCASIGILWLLQFIGVKAGEPLVPPEMRYISFAVMMASTIFFSTLVGVFLGEWKGTSAKTKGLLVLGTLILIASFCAISLGSK